MDENFDENMIMNINGQTIKYLIFDWNGIFNYTVGKGEIYYVDPKYIDKFLEQGF